LACEHAAKLFVYDQIKLTGHIKTKELRAFRVALAAELDHDSFDAIHVRELKRLEQLDYYRDREIRREQIRREIKGNASSCHCLPSPSIHRLSVACLSVCLVTAPSMYVEQELCSQGYLPIDKDDDMLTEEELAMSFLLTQIEMEASLEADYSSILEASKSMAIELQTSIKEFDATEKKVRPPLASFSCSSSSHRPSLTPLSPSLSLSSHRV
jgi:hypothetical protein